MNQKNIDYGNMPLITNLAKRTIQNNNFRTTLWTGNNLQLTLMSILPLEDIGLEKHDVEQFIYIVDGKADVLIYNNANNQAITKEIESGYALFIPSNTWHNIINKERKPLKLYSIYAPANHKKGTVHITKEDAMKEEKL